MVLRVQKFIDSRTHKKYCLVKEQIEFGDRTFEICLKNDEPRMVSLEDTDKNKILFYRSHELSCR